MDDRVRTLLDRVRDTAVAIGEMMGDAARSVGKCAGQVAKAAALHGALQNCKREISGLFGKIGQGVYNAQIGGADAEAPLDGLLATLDEKFADLAGIKLQLAALRSGTPCSACGTLCGWDDRFCKACGAPLSALPKHRS